MNKILLIKIRMINKKYKLITKDGIIKDGLIVLPISKHYSRKKYTFIFSSVNPSFFTLIVECFEIFFL